MITFYDTQQQARTEAQTRGLREKVLCYVVRDRKLLVFDHVPPQDAGVQVVAGGVEPGETPAQAAIRELFEESGQNLQHPTFLISYLWEAQLPDRFTRQVCHAYAFAAPDELMDTWDHIESGAYGQFLFHFRWADLKNPGLDWEMDAALPELMRRLSTPQALRASSP